MIEWELKDDFMTTIIGRVNGVKFFSAYYWERQYKLNCFLPGEKSGILCRTEQDAKLLAERILRAWLVKVGLQVKNK